MQIRNLTVAVTGGAGFIGSHVVDQLLALGNRVVVYDNFATGTRANVPARDGLRVIEGDVCDVGAVERALSGVEVVFHMATNCVRLSLTDPVTNHDVNATGTLNTLLAARKAGVKRYVYCSSSEVYGNVAEGVLSEEGPKLPTTVYGASKLVGEHYALAFHQTYGVPAMVVRPFNAYGPRSYFSGPYGEVIPRFTVMVRSGRQPVIFGDGKQTRDFTYVEDTASLLIASAETDALLGDSINLAHGEEVAIAELTLLMCELLGVPYAPKYIADRPGDIRKLGCDIRKMKRVLGRGAETTIRAGLEKYFRWIDAQKLDFEELGRQLTDKNWTEAAAKPRA